MVEYLLKSFGTFLTRDDFKNITDAQLSDFTNRTNRLLGQKNFDEFLKEAGIQQKSTILYCIWMGNNPQECDSFFKRVVTKYGNCFTFNYENMKRPEILKQMRPGGGMGLTMLVDIEQGEYSGK